MTANAEVDAYIAAFPDDVRAILNRLRETVMEIAPNAVEGIAYGMPGYKLNGKPLVYFAGYKKHIGLYATPTGHEAFEAELSHYKRGKGSVQFPLGQDIPWDLIRRMVQFRVDELSA